MQGSTVRAPFKMTQQPTPLVSAERANRRHSDVIMETFALGETALGAPNCPTP
jgi:hypothetical protein